MLHAHFRAPRFSGFIDKWRVDRDPVEDLACLMMEADFARAEMYEDRLLREAQSVALESECISRGIIPLDLDADPIAIPGMTRVDLGFVEGCDDGEDWCEEWSDPDEG